MAIYGLIGKHLSHSFSRDYFLDKFTREGFTGHDYRNFEMEEVSGVRELLIEHPDLAGFNVTIPFKQKIIPLLDVISPEAVMAGAVNTVKVVRVAGRALLAGYNTDITGFRMSLGDDIQDRHAGALILGTGGAARAVAFVLKQLHVPFLYVSRSPRSADEIPWESLDNDILGKHTLIINTTPLGMYPDEVFMPALPLAFIGHTHFVYDLIYNPPETKLMRECAAKGARVKNGLEMLQLQAEASWNVWNKR